jgi:nicotinamidase-related amidase
MKNATRLLQANHCALLVVDLQEKLVPAIFENDRVVENASLLIECAKVLKIPILLTQQYPPGLGLTIRAIRDILPPALRPIEKIEFGCFNSPKFHAEIQKLKPQRNTLLVAGIESHICVAQTVLGALEDGFHAHVASDATSSRTEFNWKVGLERMREAGALMSSSEMIIYELLSRSGTPEFKTMLTHLK